MFGVDLLTHCRLVLSADKLCKRFGTRSGLTNDIPERVFSPLEPIMSHSLKVRYCDRWMSGVCFKGHLLNYWLDFYQTWNE